MLDEFRSTSITWDKATRRIYSPITANASDSNGRKLNIQVVNSGQVENLTGATLHLYWETKDKLHDGLDAFDASDISKGEFELFYTTGMLSNVGELNATLVLVDSTGKVVSDWFKITVTRGINEGAIESENSFSSLTQALIDISNLEQNYAPRLNDLTAQLHQIAYQVKSNGIADSDNINFKIDYISNQGGGTLLLPDKEYLIDKEIIFKSNVKLYSQQGTVLKQKDGANLPNLIRGTELENVHIANMTFDLNTANQPNYLKGQESNIGRCILLTSSNNIKIDTVKTTEMFGTSIYIVDSSKISISNSEINDTFGRYITGIYLVRCTNAKVSKSRFYGQREFGVASSSYGVQAKDNVHQITVDDCYFEKFQCLLDGSENGAATPVNRGTSLKITNCTFQSPSADTTIRYAKHSLMTNNIVRDSADYGISVGDSEHVLVSDNVVEGSNTVGIGIRNSNNCIVSNNILRDPCVNFRPDYPLVQNQRAGIYIIGTSTRAIVDGNTITDYRNSPSQMFHAIRVEDFSGGVKGDGIASALITNNVCYGSSSGIDIYADGINNRVMPTNLRNDNKYTGIHLGTDPFASSKLGDLRHNVITQKPYFHDGSAWRNIPKQVTVPATPTSPGKAGDIAMNSSYFYWCPSDNVWCRVPKDATAW